MRKALCSVVLVPLLLLGVACSGSDGKDGKDQTSETTTKDGSTTSTTSTSTTVLPIDQIDASASPYCADWKKLRSGKGVTGTGDKKKDDATRRAYYSDLVPTVEKLVSHAEAAIKADAEQTLEIIRKAADTGDAQLFETEEAHALQARLATYAAEHCTK